MPIPTLARKAALVLAPALSLATLAAGCNESPDDAPTTISNDLTADTLTFVASLTAPNGNVVEFYDSGTAALVTETGKAGVRPVLTPYGDAIRQSRLSEVFSSLRPDLKVPAALETLEGRLHAVPNGSPPQRSVTPPHDVARGGTPASSPTDDPGVVRSAVLQGCTNGCCDPDWTRNDVCNVTGANYTWYLFNSGWSTEDSSAIYTYTGTVCAAIGTSNFTVHTGDGSGGSFSVTEATYRNWWWAESTWDHFWGVTYSEHSAVNSPSDTHLHTFCGGVH
jgi:hypothetical protein